MSNLLGMAGRWIFRNSLSLLLIVTVLVAYGIVKDQVNEYLSMGQRIAFLTSGKDFLKSDMDAKWKIVVDSAEHLKLSGISALDSRIGAIEQETKQKSTKSLSQPDLKRCVVMGGDTCNQYIEGLKLAAEISLLKCEHDYLVDLRTVILIEDGAKELERLRLAHSAAYSEYQSSEIALKAFSDLYPVAARIPGKKENIQYKTLNLQRDSWYAKNMQASSDYKKQKDTLDSLKRGRATLKKWTEQVDAFLMPLSQEISSTTTIYREKWVAIFFDSVTKVIPTAIGILLGIILTPIGIKGFYYLVIAPIASRRAGIRLLPDVSGAIDGATENMKGDFDRLKVSEVSHSITINKDQELLLHPEYLQSSASHGTKDTKWLLDWSYPLTSAAAGLFGLTRIRTASTDTIVVSSTKDPLSEVGVISLPEGSALVLQPHRLIGVVHSTKVPIRISKHWRLGSLHAWLTLQLRFLVFHGPVKLVVKGCRGVRVEAAGNGRSINQAATIGFSANLTYATTRCETFGAYLMGKQELFNDSFGGGHGFYVYEEMPHGGQKTGLFGRGIEGLTDSLLKVLGV
jgi:hypothetical protein